LLESDLRASAWAAFFHIPYWLPDFFDLWQVLHFYTPTYLKSSACKLIKNKNIDNNVIINLDILRFILHIPLFAKNLTILNTITAM